MKIEHNYVPKNEVSFCKIDSTLDEALAFLEKMGYRCVPVLDNDGKKFLGNIYKVDILERLIKNKEDGQKPIAEILDDKDACIYEQDSYFKAFFTIRELPYIAVLNEQDEFVGILTHARVMDILEDSWGIKTGQYSVTVTTLEYKGALKRLSAILAEEFSISALFTLDDGDRFIRRIVFSLPKGMTEEKIEDMTQKLEANGFRVVSVDKIKKD